MSENAATPSAVASAAPGYRAALERYAWALAPVWTALGALLLNLFLLGRRSLRFEEVQALDAANGSWGDLWAALRDRDAPHAFADLMLKAELAIDGDGAWSLRLPAAVAGALAVGLLCILGRRLLGRVAGLIAAGALATSAAVVAWSQLARSESFVLAAVVLTTLAFVAAIDRPATWRWALWGLTAALAVAISLLAVPVVAAHVAAFAVRRPRQDWRAPALALACVAAVGLAAVALVAGSQAGDIVGGTPEGRELGLELWRLVGSSPVPIAIAALGVFVLVTGRVAGANGWVTTLLVTWLAAPIAVALAISLARSSFDARYAVAATPALALLVAAGVVSQRRPIALALVGLLVASAAVTLALWYSGSSDEDWRGAVDEIRAEQQPGEAVVVLPPRRSAAAAYYAGDGYAVARPHGHRVWLLLAEDDALRRLRLARALVHPPRYALLEERSYGDDLWLQIWAEP